MSCKKKNDKGSGGYFLGSIIACFAVLQRDMLRLLVANMDLSDPIPPLKESAGQLGDVVVCGVCCEQEADHDD